MTILNDQYFNRLKSKVFKLLPLFEENNIGLTVYFDSLLNYEINGMRLYVEQIENMGEYVDLQLTLLSLLQHIKENNVTHRQVKREVLKCTNLIDKLQKHYVSGRDE